jgi:diacylglycerol kinase (ATP)
VNASSPLSGRLVLAIINPAARKRAERIVAAIQRHAPAGTEVSIHYTSRERPVGDLIASRLSEAAAVIVGGGDGTVADAVSALDDLDVPVGIIPAGSTNVIARENRIPLKPDAAARLIFGRHHLARLDVGTCGDRRFLHMAGAGFDSRFLAATSPTLKRRLGWPAYVLAAARSLKSPPVQFTISVDGTVVHLQAALVIVANGSAIVRPSLPIFPGLRRDDGRLDVVAFTPVGMTQIGRTIVRFLMRRLDRSPYVVHLRGRSVTLKAEPPILYELDGDIAGQTPVSFGVLPGALRLIVPEAGRTTQHRDKPEF